MKFMNEENEKNDGINTPHSSRSTVLISESPRTGNIKDKSSKNKKELQEAFDVQNCEMEDPVEDNPNLVTTLASKAIKNVVTHDGPLIQPKAQEVAQANLATMRHKVIEIILRVL